MIIEKIKNFLKSDYIKKAMRIAFIALPAVVIEILFLISMKTVGVGEGDSRRVVLIHAVAAVSILVGVFGGKAHAVIRWVIAVLSPAVSFYLLEYITHDPFSIDADIIFLNLAVFYAAAVFLTLLFKRTAVSVVFITVVPILFGLVSYYTSLFRGAPLFPWDIASYGVAATVAGNYEINLTVKITLIAALAILLVQTAVKCGAKISYPKKFIRPVASVLSLAAVLWVGSYLQTDAALSDFGLYPYLFTPDILYERNGFTVSFLMNLRYTTVERPQEYSNKTIRETAEENKSDSAGDFDEKDAPNIIAIMNESFADMSVLCNYTTSEECLPFISSLEENTIKGNLHVSVVGGNTPNSEFEFLTGLTMGYLPSGSIAYQQFIKKSSPALPAQLSDLGYKTIAMHPYYETGWKRDEVYPMFDFDETYFINDFYGADMIRGYVSDAGMYAEIIKKYNENKAESDGPLFVFGVTMQNHSGYTSEYENFTPYITVDGLEDNFALTTYMSLVRESDAAFEALVDYFSDVDEKTIILMFGDHQPNDSIAGPLMNQAGVSYSSDDVAASAARYITPYILWANYDIDEDDIGDVSANYLSSVLTDVAGIPQTGAQKYLSGLMREYPVITSQRFMNSDKNIYPISDYEKKDELLRYAALQYNYLFDRKSMPEFFWTLNP